MIRKIDILLKVDQLITEANGETNIFGITTLEGQKQEAYDKFISLIQSKNPDEFNHIYVSDTPEKRYVLLLEESFEIRSIQEFNYSFDLSDDEQQTFDFFFYEFIAEHDPTSTPII